MRTDFGKYHDMSSSDEEEEPPSKKQKTDTKSQQQPNVEPEMEYEQPSWGYQPQFIDPQQFVFDQEGRPMFFDEKGELIYAETESEYYPESEVSDVQYQGQNQGQNQNQNHSDPYHINGTEEDMRFLSTDKAI